MGGVRAEALRAAVRRTVAGGATGQVPVATPAAMRHAHSPARTRVPARARVRQGAAKAPEQLCLAV
jgi:hypothetical protein